MTTNDGGPAFPIWAIDPATGQVINGCFYPGMTLRDWFAGQALVGWLSGPCQGAALDGYDGQGDPSFREHQRAVAATCVGYADALVAMLRERER